MRIFCCGLLLVSLVFGAEVVTFDNHWADSPLFNVVSQSTVGCEFVFSMHEMVIEETSVDGVPMKTFGVPAVFLAEPGVPNLTGASRYLAIPQGADVEVTILDVRTEVYDNIEVAPAPNIPREDDDTPLRYEKNMAIYGRDAYYPESPVQVSEPKKMRGVDVVIVGVLPFQYNPVTKGLVVYKDIKFRVDFVGGNGHFGEDRLRSRFWEPMLQGHLLNYGSLPEINFYAPERLRARDGVEYIIIVPNDPIFEAWGDTIKQWRQLQGISCDVFTLTEVGGSSATAIENFLNNAYNTWDPAPVAFLLLSDYPSSGDVYGITSPVWSSYCISDNIYADVDGDDLPDMHHARICAQTEAHLDTIISKFLNYERNPYTAANFYDEPLCACGWQDDRWFQLASEVVRGFLINELGKNPARQYNLGSPANPTPGGSWSTRGGTAPVVAYWNAYGYVPLTNPYDATWWNNGSAAGVNAAINSGAFFIQHRDHGSETGWGEPSYHNSDLDYLTNTMYTFVNTTNCLTGMYNWSSECFAEKFHRIQYGAMGLNAASEVSYSFVNDTYIWGMWDCMYPDFDPGYPLTRMTGSDDLRPCMAMTSGKYYLDAMWFPDSVAGAGGLRVYTDHLFHHHGDAFVTLYSEVPESLLVSHEDNLVAGATTFTVTADNGSVIALTVNGEIIGVGEGTGGPVHIPISPQTPGNIMKVTVTKANHYRYEVGVPITSSDYPYVVFSRGLTDDSSGGNNDGIVNPAETVGYGVWAKNVGTGTAQDIYGLLSESDPYVSMSIDSSFYGDIPEDDSSLSAPYYAFSVADNCPNGHKINFTLEFHDTHDSLFTSYPLITVYAPILSFVGVSVENDNNGDGILDPGETADLIVTIENEGGAAAEDVTSILSTDSPHITITDGSGSFGTINPGISADNASDPYNVTADVAASNGTVVDLELEVVSGVYRDTLQFTIVVGRKHYYLWNPDPTATPGNKMDSILTDLGYSGDYGTSLAPDLSIYQSVLVCVGIYPSNHVISSGGPEAAALVDYLENQGGRVYLEGGDIWYYDPPWMGGYDFGPLFGIDAIADGTSDLGPVLGESGTFTDAMNFTYSGENSYMDHINATGTGFLIFHDGNNAYNCGVANDPGTYRTVGTSFELGLLNDATPPSTRTALLDSIMKFFGIAEPEEAIPPSAPAVIQAEKSGTDAQLTWNKITTDTLGNPEEMDCYVVYRSTSPSFVPSNSDSVGVVMHPETVYVDTAILDSSESHYYLVKAVDEVGNKSKKSNMSYVFYRFINENTGAQSDRNWVGLPFTSEYDSVRDITDDLSPTGNPISKITMLDQETQDYYSWIYHPVIGWYGSGVPGNFPIIPGRAYEMVAVVDDTVIFVGCNDPDGLVNLNENPGSTGDRNWVAIPYNVVYSAVSAITDELSPNGDPVTKISMIDEETQMYYSWIHHPALGWYGNHPTTQDFPIEPGHGYEFVAVKDTSWNPTEYSNSASEFMAAKRVVQKSDIEIRTGKTPDAIRTPVWSLVPQSRETAKKTIDYSDARLYQPAMRYREGVDDYRELGISHIVYADLEVEGLDNLVFTVYRPQRPYDVLIEQSAGSVIARKDGVYRLISFDVGNFKEPWRDGEEVVLLIEATGDERGYCAAVNFELDKGVDIQKVSGEITLVPIPELEVMSRAALRSEVENDNVVGYSLYRDDKRINDKILQDGSSAETDVTVKLVIKGGYETVYSSRQGAQSYLGAQTPISYAFTVSPNPFVQQTRVEYALPRQTSVEIIIYDVCGRQIKALVSEIQSPGYYSSVWNGCDEKGRNVASGVYFIRFDAGELRVQDKILLVK